MEPIQSGEIIVDGLSFNGLTLDLTRLRAEVGMVFQQFNLYPHMTVLENITLAPIKVRRLPRARAEAIARDLLAKVGIPVRAIHYPAQLSRGQQQRVAITRALAMHLRSCFLTNPPPP